MMYLNPSKMLEVIDALERQNIEYNTLYERICQCRSEIDKYNSFTKENDELGKIVQELNEEIEHQKKQIDILNQITEMYLMSDDRALDRTEGGTKTAANSVSVKRMSVPENNLPIEI